MDLEQYSCIISKSFLKIVKNMDPIVLEAKLI